MKTHYKPLATTLAAALQLAATAAVPVAWTNSPGMPPYPIKPVPHGSTVDLAVTLKGYTTPPIADGADVRLWYQTNGMGSAWWSAPATFDGSTITATFGPAQDCGADRVSLFFGAPSNVFASAVLRLTHAPGFDPARLPLPVQYIDFATVELRNVPWADAMFTNRWGDSVISGNYVIYGNDYWHDEEQWGIETRYTRGGIAVYGDHTDFEIHYPVLDFGAVETFATTRDVARAADDATNHTNAAIPPAISNVVTKSYVENLGITSEESDPVWSADKPNYATKMDLESESDLARARHDYRWAARQGVLYRIDFDADGYQYLTPVTNVNALAEGNEHILIHLEEQRHGNAD